ncbi:hypothetical protein FSP39_021701 [Pinctada imbricata]|uniref:Uncharacterized protein n=1 Tax=Pinctada imbricata TaxID=66713 RepID=A0AA88XTP1_PINIB|nr:hypothetical protein FSP39_021701 [Pinctada imbricata]
MGLMQKIIRRVRLLREKYSTSFSDSSLDLIAETADFFVDVRRKFTRELAELSDDEVLTKMEIIIELDTLIRAGSDLVMPLEYSKTPDRTEGIASHRTTLAYIKLLRRLVVQSYFYLESLKREDCRFDRKFFLRLKRDGLVRIDENDFIQIHNEENSDYENLNNDPISEIRLQQALELRNNALLEMATSDVFALKIKRKVRSASMKMKSIGRILDLMKPSSKERGDCTVTNKSANDEEPVMSSVYNKESIVQNISSIIEHSSNSQ